MRSWTSILIFGAALLSSSCETTPPVPECLVTIGFNELADALWDCPKGDRVCAQAAMDHFIIGVCRKPDGTRFRRPSKDLDGNFAYSPEDRERLINWAREVCNP